MTNPATPTTLHKPTRLDFMLVLYKLPGSQARLLEVLIDRVLVTPEHIVQMGLVRNVKGAAVLVSRLRKFLTPRNIELTCRPGYGYWLEPHAKKELMAELEGYLGGNGSGEADV